MQEVLLVKSDFERFPLWVEAFADFDIELRSWDDAGDSDGIDYAMVWQPEPHYLAQFKNLKVVFSVGAGIDHLRGEHYVPDGVPVVRMVDAGLTAGMTEFVVFNVLRFHRFMDVYGRNQRAGKWHEIMQVPADKRRIGILGAGELGSNAAAALVALNFSVQTWSRGEKQLPQIRSFFGGDQLSAFLASSDILVCLLPLTDATQDLINEDTLEKLPKGAFFINGGRGGQVDEQALLDALNSGRLAGAALDVFKTEPLPSDSPFWQHPKVFITPHVASMTTPASSSRHIVNNIQRLRDGKSLTHVADLQQGY